MGTKTKAPLSLRIRLQYPDEDTFVASYAPNISRGGIFIQSRTPQPEGTALRFELVLKDNTRLIRGEGYVVWVKEYDASQPAQPYGMGVRFTQLDDSSQRLVERVLHFKEGAGLRPAAAPARSETQEFRRIADEVAVADAEEPQQRTGITGETRRVPRPSAAAPEARAAPVAPAAPAMIPFERRAQARPASAAAEDQAHARCRWADEQLQALIESAQLAANAVDAALRGALAHAVATDDLEELEELLRPAPTAAPDPALDPARAREELRLLLGAPEVPRVAALSVEPPPVQPYVPTSSAAQDAHAEANAPDQPATASPADEPAPSAPEPDARDARDGGADDSGFEEFSPIDEPAAEDELVPQAVAANEAFAVRDDDPALDERRRTLEDTPRVDLGFAEERAPDAYRLELGDITAVSALDTPLEEPGAADLQDLDAEPPPLDLDDDDARGHVPDDELTDLAPSWQGRADGAATERYDDLERTTDPSDGGASSGYPREDDRRADEGLDDVTVDLRGTDEDLAAAVDLGQTEEVSVPGPELLGDELAQDPDLNNEVFDALAGVRGLAAAPPPAGSTPRAYAPTPEDAPSLEQLATRARAATPAHGVNALPAERADDALDIVVDDEGDEPAAQDKQPAVRGHKSGLFRRLFGRKDS